MKIIEINGSPRLNGNTNNILNLCENILIEIQHSNNYENKYERINISEYNLKYCKGCRICFDLSEDKCPQKDNLLSIKQKIENADCIIVGSPIYVEDISGIMKNFIDRMAFNCHRPFLIGKPIYIYTSHGSISSNHALKTMKHAFLSWGGNIINCDNFRMGKIMQQQLVNKTYEKTIRKRMYQLINQYRNPKISFYNLISFAIQKCYRTKFKGTTDYNYWLKMNWLETDCIYYTHIHINIFKKYIILFLNTVLKRIH